MKVETSVPKKLGIIINFFAANGDEHKTTPL